MATFYLRGHGHALKGGLWGYKQLEVIRVDVSPWGYHHGSPGRLQTPPRRGCSQRKTFACMGCKKFFLALGDSAQREIFFARNEGCVREIGPGLSVSLIMPLRYVPQGYMQEFGPLEQLGLVGAEDA